MLIYINNITSYSYLRHSLFIVLYYDKFYLQSLINTFIYLKNIIISYNIELKWPLFEFYTFIKADKWVNH